MGGAVLVEQQEVIDPFGRRARRNREKARENQTPTTRDVSWLLS